MTTVVAGGTCLALAISRSYFEPGGSPTGPIAAIFPISLSFNMTFLTRITHPSAMLGMMPSPAPLAEPT